MTSWRALCGTILFGLFCTAATAQDDPEAVYGKMHRAALAGKSEEVISYGTKAQQADLASKSKAEKDAVIGFMAKMLPKTYTITEKTIAPDGQTALLRGTGVVELIGKSDSYLTANFKKEGAAWKVEKWGWSSDKPAAAAAGGNKPALPVAVKPAVPVPAPVAAPVPNVAATPPTKAEPVQAVVAPKRPSRSHLDARECLKQPSAQDIMVCAERFR